LFAHDIGQPRGMGARALVGGNVEAQPVLAGQGADRVGIGCRLLTWVDAGGLARGRRGVCSAAGRWGVWSRRGRWDVWPRGGRWDVWPRGGRWDVWPRGDR